LSSSLSENNIKLSNNENFTIIKALKIGEMHIIYMKTK